MFLLILIHLHIIKSTFFAYIDRMVTFSNNVEPANGFLLRYLHRKAAEAYHEEGHFSTRHQELLSVLDWIPQLWYHLHTFLEKHSTSDFLIGEIRWTQGWKSLTESESYQILAKCSLPQAPASFCHARCLWKSSGSGSLTCGTTPLYHTCKREPETASR